MPYCCQTVLKPEAFDCVSKTTRPCSLDKYRYSRFVSPFSIQSRQRCSTVCSLIRSNAFNKRTLRSKHFRFFYDRGDLPCTIFHRTKGQSLKWFVDDIESLNIDYYLPIFADGLCETKYPYDFIAYQGVLDLLEDASHKIDLETLSKLIMPLKHALYSYDPIVIKRVLTVLQKLARGNDGAIGVALVPYFSQLLPIINILRERHQEKLNQTPTQCSLIDGFKTNTSNELVRLIDKTLVVLEQFGGPDAFINIKYSVPTYEQQADIKQLSSTQIDTILQPFIEL